VGDHSDAKQPVGDRPPHGGSDTRSVMAKKVVGFVKLQIPAGKANPAPPVGTALGPQGINIMAFCKEFNSRTQGQDTILPVEITIYSDKSFTFILKTPPAAVLLKKEAGIEKRSAFAKFDETVEVAVRLGVDPRHADQVVRGTVVLPAGTGKAVRVLVIAAGDKAKEAEQAGADYVGPEYIQKIKDGWLDFDV